VGWIGNHEQSSRPYLFKSSQGLKRKDSKDDVARCSPLMRRSRPVTVRLAQIVHTSFRCRSGRSTGRAGNGRTQMQASLAVPRARTSLGRQQVILGRAAGERSGRPGGRTRCAPLTRYAFGDDTIGSRGFIAAVTRTAGPQSFGGAGL
jgi:hypothetical protein